MISIGKRNPYAPSKQHWTPVLGPGIQHNLAGATYSNPDQGDHVPSFQTSHVRAKNGQSDQLDYFWRDGIHSHVAGISVFSPLSGLLRQFKIANREPVPLRFMTQNRSLPEGERSIPCSRSRLTMVLRLSHILRISQVCGRQSFWDSYRAPFVFRYDRVNHRRSSTARRNDPWRRMLRVVCRAHHRANAQMQEQGTGP